MAKIVKLKQNRNIELNLDFNSFNRFVLGNIKLGYKDLKGGLYLSEDIDDIDIEKDYRLQKPSELLVSKIGWCFDVNELYREYAFAHKLPIKTYYTEYYDEEAHLEYIYAFAIIQQRDGLWYLCSSNTELEYQEPLGHEQERDIVSQAFYAFKHYVKETVFTAKRECFYINEYSEPDNFVYENKICLVDWCHIEPLKKEEYKKEVSAMAIVFAEEPKNEYSVLLLRTNHREWVFPKGHIEGNEQSKDAAIRECKEESGVDISNAKYIGRVDHYTYQFDSYDLEMTNDMFYELFGAAVVEKYVDVFAFFIKGKQPIKWQEEERFVGGEWVPCKRASRTISFANTKEMYKKAYRKFKRQKGFDEINDNIDNFFTKVITAYHGEEE